MRAPGAPAVLMTRGTVFLHTCASMMPLVDGPKDALSTVPLTWPNVDRTSAFALFPSEWMAAKVFPRKGPRTERGEGLPSGARMW